MMKVFKNIKIKPGNASHSKLQVIKTLLLGEKLFSGGEQFLKFGSSFHELALLYKTKFTGLSEKEKSDIKNMVESLNKHKVAVSLLKDTIREQRQEGILFGVKFTYILDAKKTKCGMDLKTTSCTNFGAFLAYAIKHGLFSQALTYMLAERLDSFYFIAPCKKPPHKIFIIPAHRFPDELAYSKEEIQFLVYVFNNANKK